MEQGALIKNALDGAVAELLGRKVSDVSAITSLFLHEVVRGLVEHGEVRLDGLGTLHVTCRSGKRASRTVLTSGYGHRPGRKKSMLVRVERKYYVSFRKATRLREALWARFGKLEPRSIP
jgi:nucleoid DNA-binding protein